MNADDASFDIQVQNEPAYPVDADALARAARRVLEQHEFGPDGTALTIVLTDDAAVAQLNAQFRGTDTPTDVLSFPAGDALTDEDADYLGDLIIAYPYARAQAERLGHPLADSLALLVIHGTLHLLGYDHDTPEGRAEMWAAQHAALLVLGIDPALVPVAENDDH